MDAALPAPEDLLAELKFAQRIALHLVRDQELADDVAQEAVIAALARHDVSGRERRAWLSGVVRNLVNNRRRDLRRRREREARYALDGERFESAGTSKEESAASVAIERAEQKALVVNAVMALSEPYRTVIVLRYMEELSPPAIAAELGRSRETVKTQLRRGMAQLREQLDAENGGDGSTWALALLPLAVPEMFPVLAGATVASEAGGKALASWKSGGAAKTLGGQAATAKIALGVASVAAIAVAAVLMVSVGTNEPQGVSPEPLRRGDGVASTSSIEGSDVVVGMSQSGTGRTSLELAADMATEAGSDAEELAAVSLVHDRKITVVDAATGSPLPGATIVVASHVLTEEDAQLAAVMEDVGEEGVEVGAIATEEEVSAVMIPLGDNLDAIAEMLLNPSMGGMADEGEPAVHSHPGVDEQIRDTNDEGEASVSVPDHAIVCIQVFAEGYSEAALIDLSDEMEWPLRVELNPAGALKISRGAVDDAAVIAVALTDMLTGTSRAILLSSGQQDELVNGCEPGVYRLSARAVLPGSFPTSGVAEPMFEVRQRTIVVEEDKPAEVSLFDSGPERILVTLTGPGSLADGLTLRAASLHRGASTSLMVDFASGEAVVEALSGRPVSLIVLRDGSEVARKAVVCEPGRLEPLEVEIALAAGELLVDTGDYGGALSLSLASSETAGEDARKKELTAGRSDDERRARFTNVPEGSYELWWAHGARAGSVQVEIGAGTSTVALQIAADGTTQLDSHLVRLEVCPCALPVLGTSLRTASGQPVPLHLADDLFALDESAFASGDFDPSEGPAAELHLPPGDYVLSYRGMDFGVSSQAFTASAGAEPVVLHSSAENVEVRLRLQGATGSESLLVVESGIPGATKGDGLHGQMVDFNGEETTVTWLPPGKYRASNGRGQSTTFTVEPETDFLELTLR